ncbi:hypothetical protein [Chroococcidiopsis sp. SAG 2025]|uniref:hypothetical protein n=1 Tax=Chroococcidiopsis sp. SAG 2025 TaxID=171389 RepID=UPI002936E1EF|nr:hypothetical protein [Chroococcidiopsis sp. SAG 2025]
MQHSPHLLVQILPVYLTSSGTTAVQVVRTSQEHEHKSDYSKDGDRHLDKCCPVVKFRVRQSVLLTLE